MLSDAVRAWVQTRPASNRHWLPFVVFATESGYRYTGEDYWPTLNSNAPGWERHTSREYVSRRFKAFAEAYGGAVPKGRWAGHFRIICWPITHAILPTDLQLQLARLLYEYRGALTAQLLESPDELGSALASRTSYASKRLQQFAENHELLGQVACALLAGAEQPVTLLPSTLERLVDDLSGEREARRWLSDAKRAADRVRVRGASVRARPRTLSTRSDTDEKPRATAPISFALHPTAEGWQLRLRVPDYGPLKRRYPPLADALADRRCVVTGFRGPPRPRSWLDFPGQPLALDSWPGSDCAMFQLERTEERTNQLLRDESRSPVQSRWLFRVSDGVGRLVRSGAVRPGGDYLLMGPDVERPTGCDWANSVLSACVGAGVVRMNVPDEIGGPELEALGALGVGTTSTVSIDPVGVPPAAWDGESCGEWLVGDDPLLAITTERVLAACTIAVPGLEPMILSHDDLCERFTFVELTELPVGTHLVRFSFLFEDESVNVPDAFLEVRIREPGLGSSAGTYREPLQLLPIPITASLEDVWEGSGSLEIHGPPGGRARLSVQLLGPGGELTSEDLGAVPLPVAADGWARVLSQLRRRPAFQRGYDDASAARFEVGDTELGSVVLQLDRASKPLRWGHRVVDRKPSLRLHQQVDSGSQPVVRRYAFATPDVGEVVQPDADGLYQHPEGGLFVATLDGYTASAILVRPIHDLHDLRQLGIRKRLQKLPRCVASVESLIELSRRWASAALPGDPFAESARRDILAHAATAIAGLIGGRMWEALEDRVAAGARVDLTDWEAALAKPGQWADFRKQVGRIASRALDLSVDELVIAFAQALGEAHDGPSDPRIVSSAGRSRVGSRPATFFAVGGLSLAEFLLRLSAAPETLPRDANQIGSTALQEVLEHPIVYRAARLLTVAGDLPNREDVAWT